MKQLIFLILTLLLFFANLSFAVEKQQKTNQIVEQKNKISSIKSNSKDKKFEDFEIQLKNMENNFKYSIEINDKRIEDLKDSIDKIVSNINLFLILLGIICGLGAFKEYHDFKKAKETLQEVQENLEKSTFELEQAKIDYNKSKNRYKKTIEHILNKSNTILKGTKESIQFIIDDAAKKSKELIKEEAEKEREKLKSFNDVTKLIDSEQHQSSITILNKIINEDSKDPYAYFLKSLVMFRTKNLDEALKNIDKSIELNPKNPEAYNLKAGIYTRKGNCDLALIEYQKAQELDQTNIKYKFNEIECLLLCSKLEKTKEELSKISIGISANTTDTLNFNILYMLLTILKNDDFKQIFTNIKEIVKNGIKTSWDFEEIRNFLTNPNLNNEQKQNIKDLIEYIENNAKARR